MFSFLLVIIYVAFISLGLPDSLVGSAWPVMHAELGVPVSYAGIITMIIAFGTIISSLLSDRLTRKFGAGLVTAFSVFLTALALFGFSVSNSFVLLCLWAIPYGLGAGAVDAALNNYVALHYASRHMSWLHCFWGVGAAVSPYIMSFSLTGGFGWHNGYRVVSIVQILLTVVLFISLPLWKKGNTVHSQDTETGHEGPSKPLGFVQILKMKGVPLVLITFFSYCALEQTAMLWASSYLVQYRGLDVSIAARFASLFCLGITAGRFLCGFIADKLGDKLLIRFGILISLIGIIFVALPVETTLFAMMGLIITGLGCAPTYPAIIHSTPYNFGRENSQGIIGIQMASAYVGTTFMPPLFGLLASVINISIFPVYLSIFAVLMMVMTERLNRIVAKKYAPSGK
ncbi:MFS transporter [uncultured Robinsoniella sp.]|uniref:MFS transporter n=1 Tax=uncultured Robinsoniella sp. TaxID=904190 RepID=UPI00374EE90B